MDRARAPQMPGYTDFEVIGSGGFATVYRARRTAFEQMVAIKVVHTAQRDQDLRMRFDRECRAMGRLAQHPHIVTVYDGGIAADGTPFLVMEYLPRGSLEDATGRLDDARVLDIGVKVSSALGSAHEHGVLHRDIKPANLLWSRYDEPLLADFGIARLADADRTPSGVVTASLAYAAPEILGGSDPSPESDVYSLAATLVCLRTGRSPYAGDESAPAALIGRILKGALPDLSVGGMAPALAAVLTRALAKDPTTRPASTSELVAALQQAQRRLGHPITRAVTETGTPHTAPAFPPSGTDPPWRPNRAIPTSTAPTGTAPSQVAPRPGPPRPAAPTMPPPDPAQPKPGTRPVTPLNQQRSHITERANASTALGAPRHATPRVPSAGSPQASASRTGIAAPARRGRTRTVLVVTGVVVAASALIAVVALAGRSAPAPTLVPGTTATTIKPALDGVWQGDVGAPGKPVSSGIDLTLRSGASAGSISYSEGCNGIENVGTDNGADGRVVLSERIERGTCPAAQRIDVTLSGPGQVLFSATYVDGSTRYGTLKRIGNP